MSQNLLQSTTLCKAIQISNKNFQGLQIKFLCKNCDQWLQMVWSYYKKHIVVDDVMMKIFGILNESTRMF